MKTESSLTPRRIKKRLNIKKKEMTIQDEEIFKHANNLLQLLKVKKTLSDIPFNHSPENISLVYYAFEKEVYNNEFSLFLSHYLSSLKPLMNILPQNNSKETLIMLSQKLMFEKHKTNQLLFRFGDYGEKFYIILKGSVNVIIYKELEIKMTYEDYISHLKRLKELKEYVLMKKIIKINTNVIKEANVNYILSLDETEEERNITIQNSLNLFKHCNSYHSYNSYNSWNSNNNTMEVISANDYIQRSFPQVLNKNNKGDNDVNTKNSYDITLWVYFNLCSLGIGKTFGDIALSNPNCVRTGTIICKEDSYLGTLTKAGYDSLVKDSQDKLRKAKIMTILSAPIFTGVRVDTFIKNYFNCFKELELNQGMTLFNQGDKREEIFLIKEGEVDITTRLSFNELTTVIEDKGGIIDKLKEKMLFYDLFIHDIPIQYKNKRMYKLFVLKDGEISGLDDCLFNNRYLCNAICSSLKSIIYCIQYSMFQRLVEEEECIKNNLPAFTEVKTEVLRNRLIVLRNNEINHRCKMMPSFSEKILFNYNSINNTNTLTNINTSNSILSNTIIQIEGNKNIKNKGCLTSRNKSEIASKKQGIQMLNNSKDFSYGNKNKTRVHLNIEDKSERMVHYSSAIKYELERTVSKSNSDYKRIIKSDSLMYSDNIIKKSKDKIHKGQFQLSTPSNKNTQSKNTNNSNSNSKKKKEIVGKTIRRKKLTISSPCVAIGTPNKASDNILEQIINISAKHISHSKGLINTNKNNNTKPNINANEDILKSMAINHHKPGVIDFLAMDKVYESSEVKKSKQFKPKVTLIPLNILLLKKFKAPSVYNKRSLSVNEAHMLSNNIVK